MDDMITSIITQLVYAGITFAMGYKWNKSRNLAAIQKNIEHGIGLILKIDLRNLHSKAMRRRYISYDEESLAEEIYAVYHALGLNGQGTAMIEDLRRLPKREVSENAKMAIRSI